MDEMEREERSRIVWKDRKRLWCGLPWTFTVYSLSRDRFFIKRGIFTLHEDEVRLYRVKDLSLRRSFGQRIFGLGSIYVCSTDSTLKDFEIKNIRKSEEIKRLMSDLVEEERDRKRVSMREFLGHGLEHDENDFEDFDVIDTLDDP